MEFIDRVTDEPLPPSSYNSINCKGINNPLNEHQKECLNWENIGIVPDVSPPVINVTPSKS